MKKLIATQSKKNSEKVRKRLESARVAISIPGELNGEINCAEALLAGHSMLARSKPDEALIVAQALLTKIDDVVDIFLLKARALLDLEALSELHAVVDPLVEAAPGNRGVLMVAARYYYLIGKAKQSIMFARKAAANDSRNVEALLHMELCYRYSGETQKAAKILERCLELAGPMRQDAGERFKQYSSALFRLANYTLLNIGRLDELESIYISADNQLLATHAAYALATQYEKRKDQASEIKYLCAANTSESKVLGLEPRLDGLANSYEKKYARQIKCFDSCKPTWFSDPLYTPDTHDKNSPNHTPVFVLGLPRSGTTLLEQILGGHSKVGQVGESKAFLNALKNTCRKINPVWGYADYPSYLDRLSAQSLRNMVNSYELHQSLLTDKKIYVDKELANFEYVGLMALLFPAAKFIHMDRAPMDIFLSCFRNSIPGVPETSNLKAIAEYYLYMKRLIGYWRSLYPDRFLVINYQSLVQEPEKLARQAAEFIGIDFEPAMLEFHERKNIVRTLSVDQVRKKIYTTSVEGWRAYSHVLAPARAVLEQYNIPIEGVGYL